MSFELKITFDQVSWSDTVLDTPYLTNRWEACRELGKREVHWLEATFYPVRTNKPGTFLKDLLLPTTSNHASRIDGAVKKIFALIGALALDAVTLPIRLVTSIPRIALNFFRADDRQKVKNILDDFRDLLEIPLEAEFIASCATSDRVFLQRKVGEQTELLKINFFELPQNIPLPKL